MQSGCGECTIKSTMYCIPIPGDGVVRVNGLSVQLACI